MTEPMTRPSVLVIAGLDPTGGAGLAADLRTLAAMDVHAAPVVSVSTVQGEGGVIRCQPTAPELLEAQIAAACEAWPIQFAKLGALGDAATVHAVAAAAVRHRLALVIDPVLSASAGGVLLDDEGREALLEVLAPHAAALLPNLNEARSLLGDSALTAAAAAAALLKCGADAVWVTGGDASSDIVTDTVATPAGTERIERPRIAGGENCRGTGCTLSSALCGALASGLPFAQASTLARDLVQRTLQRACGAGERVLSPRPEPL